MNDTKVEGGIGPVNLTGSRDVNETKVEGGIGLANLSRVLMV